jgi:hypothetical protein
MSYDNLELGGSNHCPGFCSIFVELLVLARSLHLKQLQGVWDAGMASGCQYFG